MYRYMVAIAVGLLGWACSSVWAHEPLFGVGPHTIYQYGTEVETEVEVGEGPTGIHNEISYGITPDLGVTLAVPYVRKEAGNTHNSGLGDVTLRAKWRFFRRDFLNGQDGLALFFGTKLPTGAEKAVVPLGTGSTDFFGGIAAGRESRRWYYFGDLRYRVNTRANGLKAGNVFFYDVAWGIRPVRAAYHQPDLVLLVEANGKVAGKAEQSGGINPNTGRHVHSLSPGFLFSIRNVMLKGGVNIPVAWRLNGTQEAPDTEVVLALDSHLAPFK